MSKHSHNDSAEIWHRETVMETPVEAPIMCDQYPELMADYKATFPNGGVQYVSARAADEYEATAQDIDAHEMRNFGGAWGFCPRPTLEIIPHSPASNAKRDEVMKMMAGALEECKNYIAERERRLGFTLACGEKSRTALSAYEALQK